MISLVVDTSTSNLVLAIIKDNDIKYIFNSKIEFELSSKFIPIVDNAFRECKIEPKDIDKIFVSVGPGSFTGIRIGLAFAKTFAWSLKKDLIPFSTLELIATSSYNKCLSLIDARRGYVFRGIYDTNLNKIVQDEYLYLDDVINEMNLYDNLDCYSYDSFEKINSNIPNINVLKLIHRHINDIPINPHELKPCYLKKTEAEEKLVNDNRN